jgi:hypothetical protein
LETDRFRIDQLASPGDHDHGAGHAIGINLLLQNGADLQEPIGETPTASGLVVGASAKLAPAKATAIMKTISLSADFMLSSRAYCFCPT